MATLKNSLAFFKIKSNMQLPYNPTFPLPGIYPREMKTYVHNIFQNVHRALLIIISNGKQPKYLSTDEQVKKIITQYGYFMAESENHQANEKRCYILHMSPSARNIQITYTKYKLFLS